jgi:threonine/homoserine/homoserine lactone efflux protein
VKANTRDVLLDAHHTPLRTSSPKINVAVSSGNRFTEAQPVIDHQTLFTFMTVVLGLFLIPGPAVLMTVGRALSGGRRIGIATGLGVATGDLGHATLATVGLSALLMTSATAFQIVKLVGVGYLVYLGIGALRESPGAFAIPRARPITARRAFSQAVLAELLNPKTALFFLAFLPQFVHRENGSVAGQLATLGCLFAGMSAVFTSLIALGAGMLGRLLLRHRSIGRWQGKIVGSIYLALGARLAFQER